MKSKKIAAYCKRCNEITYAKGGICYKDKDILIQLMKDLQMIELNQTILYEHAQQ